MRKSATRLALIAVVAFAATAGFEHTARASEAPADRIHPTRHQQSVQ
jgi:hypothetical protein